MSSILDDMKNMVGGDVCGNDFNTDLIIHINSVFNALWQLGAGPVDGYFIQDSANTWDEFTDNPLILPLVQNYMYDKVRLKFDPPTSTALLEAMKADAAECEWRIRELLEYKKQSNE